MPTIARRRHGRRPRARRDRQGRRPRSRSRPTSSACWSATSARIQAVLERVSYNPEHIAILPLPRTPSAWREDPREAVRTRRTPRCWSRVRAAAEGRADAVVSAGNTGACVLACAQHFRCCAASGARRWRASIRARPSTPGRTGWRCSSTSARPCAARPTSWCSSRSWAAPTRAASPRCASPRVGLLNMGARADEGRRGAGRGAPAAPRAAAAQLRRQRRGQRAGARQGRRDRLRGAARQRRAEAARGHLGARSTTSRARRPSSGSSWRLGLRLLSQGIERVRALTDYTQYGGAPILGFERLFIKCHGRSNARAIANAVKVAAKAVRDRVPAEIADALGRHAMSRIGFRRRTRRARPGCRRSSVAGTSTRRTCAASSTRSASSCAPPSSAARTRSTCRASPSSSRRCAPPPTARQQRSRTLLRVGEPAADRQGDPRQARPRRRAVRRHRLQEPAPAPPARAASTTCASTSASSWPRCCAAGSTAPPDARELLFGDDWESDPLIYSLYADVLAGRSRAARLAASCARVRRRPGAPAARSCALARRAPAAGRRRAHLHQPRAAHAAGRLPPVRRRASCRPSTTSRPRCVLAADGTSTPTTSRASARALIERSGLHAAAARELARRPRAPPAPRRRRGRAARGAAARAPVVLAARRGIAVAPLVPAHAVRRAAPPPAPRLRDSARRARDAARLRRDPRPPRRAPAESA